MISHVTSCTHSVLLSKRMSSPIMPKAHFSLEVCAPMEDVHPWHWNLRTIISVQSTRLSWAKKIWVMKHNTSRVMKHNPILQCAMSPTHGWKSCLGDREVSSFRLSWYCLFSSINASLIVSCAPSFINHGMRFLLRGRAITPRVMVILITSELLPLEA
jgi:hypothetical protein